MQGSQLSKENKQHIRFHVHLEGKENIALQSTFPFSPEYSLRRPSSFLLGKVKVIARKIYVLHQGRIEFAGLIFI